jgi:hypothetical protein
VARKPGGPFARRAGWLAVAVSFLGHAALIVGLWTLAHAGFPGQPKRSVAVCVVTLEDEHPSQSTTPAVPEQGDAEEQEPPPLPLSSNVVLPETTEPPASLPDGPGSRPGEVGTEAGPVPGGSGGGPALARGPAAFFHLPVRGQSVVFLIDRSSSMGFNGGLSAAKREVADCLTRLPESSSFQVIVYNRDPVWIGGRKALLPATAANIESALQVLDTIGALGSTNHVEALRCALQFEPDVLFLVTDADELTREQVRVLTQLNRGRTTIHTLAWGQFGTDTDTLRLLAEQNGGTHRGLPITP